MADLAWPDAQVQQFVDVIVARVTRQVTDGVGELVEHLERQSEEFRNRYTQLEERYADLEAELDLYKALSHRRQTLPVASDLPPRPPQIDLACTADPADGPQEVTVKVYDQIVHRTITPGSDPAEVWRNACEAVSSYYMGAAR